MARYADACNVFDIPDGGATARHKLAVLEKLCAGYRQALRGDREDHLEPAWRPGESAASFVERCRAFADLGIDHVGVVTTGPWTEDAVATLAAAVPALDGLGSDGRMIGR